MDDINSITPTPSSSPWLTVIGVGEEGVQDMSAAARDAIAHAHHIFGAERLLKKVVCPASAHVMSWPTPFSEGVSALLHLRHTPQTVVLVSGDPFHYGLGGWLSEYIPRHEMTIMPSLSSISYACAHMGWLQQHTTVLSLHGRDETALYRVLEDGQRVLILTSDAHAPHRLMNMLSQAGFGHSRVGLLEALGGPQERCRHLLANQFDDTLCRESIHPLNIVALELVADRPENCHGLVPGRPDDLFENDGQITRSDIRAMTLARLRPHPGKRLWDIGAGSGAIAIEWLRSGSRMSALAIERCPTRCQTIQRNAQRFGVPHLQLLSHDLQLNMAILDQQPTPDAVFIGGGACQGVTEYCMTRLAPHGRLVINAVTLETEQLLYTLHTQHGGQLTRIAMEYVEPLGRLHGWKPARTITQWCWQRMP